MRVPASHGREGAPVVVLQSHLDIVCERDPDSPFDPREGRIDVRVEDDWVRANGTTLGADNGIGVAAALAVADDDAIEHGPLELLFTVSEEQGLDGAKALDASLVAGRLLVNLDGTSDEALTIGCAGSDHTLLRLPLARRARAGGRRRPSASSCPARGAATRATTSRAGRVNAIKALGRVLAAAYRGRSVPARLARRRRQPKRDPARRSRGRRASRGARGRSFRSAAETELARDRAAARRHGRRARALDRRRPSAEARPTSSRRRDVRSTSLAAIPTGVVAIAPGLAERRRDEHEPHDRGDRRAAC